MTRATSLAVMSGVTTTGLLVPATPAAPLTVKPAVAPVTVRPGNVTRLLSATVGSNADAAPRTVLTTAAAFVATAAGESVASTTIVFAPPAAAANVKVSPPTVKLFPIAVAPVGITIVDPISNSKSTPSIVKMSPSRSFDPSIARSSLPVVNVSPSPIEAAVLKSNRSRRLPRPAKLLRSIRA